MKAKLLQRQTLIERGYHNTIKERFKVAEHSFRARFFWCNWARAQGLQKTNMPSTERSFYLLNTRTICAIFLSIIERSAVLMALVFYYKDMLEKVTSQRTQQFSVFSLLPKEPS